MRKIHILPYFFILVLTTLIFFYIARSQGFNFTFPLRYVGDAIESLAHTKSVLRNDLHSSWYAPYSYDGYHPSKIVCVSIYQLLLKIIGLFTGGDLAKTANIYYFVTFLLSSLSALYVMSRCGIAYPVGISLALLYSFLPFHFARNISHLQFSSYFLVPLLTLVLLWIWSDGHIFFRPDTDNIKLNLFGFKAVFGFILIVILGPITSYYVFFFIFLCCVAGLSAALSNKKMTPLLTVVILVAMTYLSVYKMGIPYRLNKVFHPEKIQNSEMVVSNWPITGIGGPEILGLKLVQLLLPGVDHRIEIFKAATDVYHKTHTVNENMSASLGVIGSAGFMVLLGILLVPRNKNKLFQQLAVLNISSFLLATIGGFSSVIHMLALGFLGHSSLLVQARSYNRISVFIAFFSLLCIGLIITKYIPVRGKKGWVISSAISLVILGFGLYDQITPGYIPLFRQSDRLKEAYASDKAFINDIELQLQKNAKVFQLPFVVHHYEWPKGLGYYTESIKPYLFSNNLQWTYGGDKDSKQEKWYRAVSSLGPQKMLHQLAVTGFSGIYIDRKGFGDNGANLEKSLTELTDIKPIVSMDKRYAFFNITRYVRKLLNDVKTKHVDTRDVPKLNLP